MKKRSNLEPLRSRKSSGIIGDSGLPTRPQSTGIYGESNVPIPTRPPTRPPITPQPKATPLMDIFNEQLKDKAVRDAQQAELLATKQAEQAELLAKQAAQRAELLAKQAAEQAEKDEELKNIETIKIDFERIFNEYKDKRDEIIKKIDEDILKIDEELDDETLPIIINRLTKKNKDLKEKKDNLNGKGKLEKIQTAKINLDKAKLDLNNYYSLPWREESDDKESELQKKVIENKSLLLIARQNALDSGLIETVKKMKDRVIIKHEKLEDETLDLDGPLPKPIPLGRQVSLHEFIKHEFINDNIFYIGTILSLVLNKFYDKEPWNLVPLRTIVEGEKNCYIDFYFNGKQIAYLSLHSSESIDKQGATSSHLVFKRDYFSSGPIPNTRVFSLFNNEFIFNNKKSDLGKEEHNNELLYFLETCILLVFNSYIKSFRSYLKYLKYKTKYLNLVKLHNK